MTQISLDQVQCIKEIDNFGNTIYKNICNGSETQIPWGQMDWLVGAILGGFIIALVIIIISIVKEN